MKIEDLSPEQQLVVRTWGQGQAVVAGAGCGKTTTMVMKLLELVRKDPEARFIAVSFTDKSAADLRAKLAAGLMEMGMSLSSHWVTTIHGLCGRILREYPHKVGLDGEESILAEDEAGQLWQQAIDRLFYQEVSEETGEALDRLMGRESKASLVDLLKRLKGVESFGALKSLQQSIRPDEQALVTIYRSVAQTYERLKFREGALDFDDLEIKASQVLEDVAVQQAFHQRFDLVLVDEFQDTNPIQASIVFHLSRPAQTNLCVVGDPKQSIYRFRDADVSVFEECCRSLPVRQELTWNFRSTPGIIEFVNQTCQPIFEAQEQGYDALEAKREGLDDPAVVCLTDATPEGVARWVVEQKRAGHAIEDYALLLRRIRGSEKWLRALASHGIPIAVGSGGRFWADPRVRELMSLLRWFWAPENQLSGANFLRAPWMEIPDQQLHVWILSGRPLWECFTESEHPLAQRLIDLYRQHAPPSQVLELLMSDPAAEQDCGQNLLGLWYRVNGLMGAGRDFGSVVAELSDAMEVEKRDREVPPPRTSGVLTVLTLHGSKGLEFPKVILVDFTEKEMRARGAPLLFWDRNRGAFLGKRDAQGNRDRKDSEEIEWRALEARQQVAESARLFYVALTRARDQLVLVQPVLTTEMKPVKNPLLKDHWRLWLGDLSQTGAVRISLDGNLQGEVSLPSTLRTVGPRKRVDLPEVRRSRWSASEWNAFHVCERYFSKKYLWAEEESEAGSGPDVDSHQVESKAARARTFEPMKMAANELGTLIHEALEADDPFKRSEKLQEVESTVGSDIFRAEPVVKWADQSEWMSGNSYPEVPFEFPAGDEVLVGAIDRLAEAGSHFAVIDFKFTVGQRSREDLLNSYQAQLELYAVATAFLEPRAWGQTRAFLVHLSPGLVTEVEVPLPPWTGSKGAALRQFEEVFGRMNELLNQPRTAPTKTRKSSFCGKCPHRSGCPVFAV